MALWCSKVTELGALYFCVLLVMHYGDGAQLSCTPDGAVEVVMNKSDNTVSCNDVGGSARDVYWYANAAESGDYNIGTCLGVQGNKCSTPAAQFGFQPSRPSGDQSVMTINGTTLLLNAFLGRRLRCDANTMATCDKLDKIYPAEATCNQTMTSSSWTVSGYCTITKVYSFAQRYSCQFFSGTSLSSQTTEVQGKTQYTVTNLTDPTYKIGSCGFNNVKIPAVNGQYYYRALILPGYVDVVFGPLTVARPSSPTASCPTQNGYVAEDGDLICTCSLGGGSIGQPPGRLTWILRHNSNEQTVKIGGYGETTLQVTLKVNRTHNNQQLRCDVDWISGFAGSPQTISVAYGPDNVTITGPPLPFDTNGSTPLTLTCQPSTSNPATLVYTWRRLPNTAVLGDKQNVTVIALHDLDGQQLQCNASNQQLGNVVVSGTFIIDLNYPPDDPPEVNYNKGEVKYAGDSLTLTCTVRGGKPVNSTAVFFDCTNKGDNASDIVTSSDVTSVLNFAPLQWSDNGLVCTCAARWKQTTWYNQRLERTLIVYYPPSALSITTKGNYPFIAGITSSATLTCSSNSTGHPAASYTWNNTFGGDVQDGTLTFATVTSDLNGRTLSCEASNNFTSVKGSPLRTNFTLNVYYSPVISVTSADSNIECQLTADGTRCDVMENAQVKVQCNARSNPDPDPDSFIWVHNNGTSASSDGVLTVASASDARDTGIYRCNVTTKPLAYVYPVLTSSHKLTLLVLFPPSQLNMTMNNMTSNLTVNEGDHVMVSCSAGGRPTPSIRLLSMASGTTAEVYSEPGNVRDVALSVTKLNYIIADKANCSQTTVVYQCSAGSSITSDTSDLYSEVQLFVLCSPRLSDPQPSEKKKVNYVGRPEQVSVNLVAYPTPSADHVMFSFKGPAGTNMSKPAQPGILTVRCWTSGLAYQATCNITINNITSDTAGIYTANFSDAVYFDFWITYNETSSQPINPDGVPAAAIGGAVGGTAFGCGLMVVVVVFIRRRGAQPAKRRTHGKTENPGFEDSVMIDNARLYNSGRDHDDDVMIDNLTYQSSGEVMQGMGAYQTIDTALNNNRPVNKRPTQTCDYEDVANPTTAAVGAAKQTADENKDVFAMDNKSKVGGGQKTDDVNVTVDKTTRKQVEQPRQKTSDLEQPSAQTTKPGLQPKPKRPAKPTKPKKMKHADKNVSGAIYGNSPLSMSPYSNYSFQSNEAEYSNGNQQENEAPHSDKTKNPDCLIYTTVAFSDEQRRKESQPHPERETTEYAGIDFSRQAPSV